MTRQQIQTERMKDWKRLLKSGGRQNDRGLEKAEKENSSSSGLCGPSLPISVPFSIYSTFFQLEQIFFFFSLPYVVAVRKFSGFRQKKVLIPGEIFGYFIENPPSPENHI